MSTDLTPAEQAAADVLAARHNAADATYSYSAAAFHDRARAVVAAARPLIEAEARASYDAEEVTVNGDVYRRRALPGILSLIMKSRDEVAREGNRLASQLSKACRERDEARAELERVRNQRDERGRSNGRQTALLVEARKDRERALEQRDALAAQLDAVRELHTLERRYTDEHAETSYDTRQEAADALGITPGATHYLDVCSHCGSIEMDSGAEDYRESLWPCPTIRALDGDGVTACTGCGTCSVCRRRGVTAHSVLGIDPAERVETTTHADPEPHGLAAIRDRVKRDTILTEAEIDGASSGWIELMQARRDRAELLAALDTELDEQTHPATFRETGENLNVRADVQGNLSAAPITLAQAAGHLHGWAGDFTTGRRTDWPAGHPDIIRGIRAAADWLDARDRYETETREQLRALVDRHGMADRTCLIGDDTSTPDVDGWTIYPTTDGGLMVSHDTDADRPTLAADDSIPLAAVLAFIADADEETPEPGERTE